MQMGIHFEFKNEYGFPTAKHNKKGYPQGVTFFNCWWSRRQSNKIIKHLFIKIYLNITLFSYTYNYTYLTTLLRGGALFAPFQVSGSERA